MGSSIAFTSLRRHVPELMNGYMSTLMCVMGGSRMRSAHHAGHFTAYVVMAASPSYVWLATTAATMKLTKPTINALQKASTISR